VGDQADPDTDRIEVDGKPLRFDQTKIYYAINKPRNVISATTSQRQEERQNVRDLVPHTGHLFTIGRLDVDSDGLMVLTNDGELANKLSHPRYMHTKVYRVVVVGLPTLETLEKWQNGVYLADDDTWTAPCAVKITKGGHDLTVMRIVMTEGKKRQIRRVASLLGHPVRRLTRVQMGMLELGDLKPGEYRALTPDEVKRLATRSPEIRLIRERARKVMRLRPTEKPASPTAEVPVERRERRERPAQGGRPGKRKAPPGKRGGGRSTDPTRGPRRKPTSPRPGRSGGSKPRPRR
jgi:pseudouridine synthase